MRRRMVRFGRRQQCIYCPGIKQSSTRLLCSRFIYERSHFLPIFPIHRMSRLPSGSIWSRHQRRQCRNRLQRTMCHWQVLRPNRPLRWKSMQRLLHRQVLQPNRSYFRQSMYQMLRGSIFQSSRFFQCPMQWSLFFGQVFQRTWSFFRQPMQGMPHWPVHRSSWPYRV